MEPNSLKRVPAFDASRYKKATGANSERAELIGKFMDRLNADRDGVKYKALTPVAVAVKLAHIMSNSDLYAFYRQCEGAKNFSRLFWWALKPTTK
jgi:hypothetical protein